MNKFEELEAFVSVVDHHGFSAASLRSGVAKSVLSRRVSDLEKRLGVQLMHRTTRKLSLTDSGRHFYRRAQTLLADMLDAEEMVSDLQGGISGKIQLAAPLTLGTGRLAKPIAQFLSLHAAININIDLSDREVDLVEEGFDLAVRVGKLVDSNLIARKLCDVNFVVCASQDYLNHHGVPSHPSDLAEHQLLVYSYAGPSRQWSFDVDGERISPRINYRISANNGECLAEMARFGLGLTIGPLFYMQKYLDSGDLQPVLTDFKIEPLGIYALYPPGRLVSRRVKMLSDYLFEYFHQVKM